MEEMKFYKKNNCSHILYSNGTKVKVKPEDGKQFNLKEIQTIVKGYIQLIYIGNYVMIINEDGKELGLPFNEEATNLFQTHHNIDKDGDFIVGDVIICPAKMID